MTSRQATVVVPLAGSEALMLRRGTTAPWMPGHWNYPGGWVDPGERTPAAAARELREESGIRVEEKALRWRFSYRDNGVLIHVFTLTLKRKPTVRSMDGEHDAKMWVPFGSYPSPATPAVPFINSQLARFW